MAVDWVSDRYGASQTARLSDVLWMTVSQDIGSRGGPTPPWRAAVFGARLNGAFESREDARAAAIRVARKHLNIASAVLDAPET